uniref:Uncharacterized protein LOC100182918 n=1 Tax=Phallusia mammillata TaxID=59560 RepID=A0A6F9DIN4_9ASCI|nr:uncharacterized protein LOC100182918 [Phallusia mammillata]
MEQQKIVSQRSMHSFNSLPKLNIALNKPSTLNRCHSTICRPTSCYVPLVDSKERFVTMENLSQLGQMKMVLCGTPNKITITVLGLRGLPTENTAGQAPSNSAYVKISLCPDEETRLRHRTAPQYVINGSVTLHDNFAFDITSADLAKRVLISAWCKNVRTEQTCFVGCMSFGVKGIVVGEDQILQGWFYFLRESLGRRKHLKVKTGSVAIATTPVKAKPPKRDERQVQHQGNPLPDVRYSTLPTRGRHSSRIKSSNGVRNAGTIHHKVYAGCQCKFCNKQQQTSKFPTSFSVTKLHKRRHSPSALEAAVRNKRQKMPGRCDVTKDPLSSNSRGALRDLASAGNINVASRRNVHVRVGNSPVLKPREAEAKVESPMELKHVSVQRTELRSARIVVPAVLCRLPLSDSRHVETGDSNSEGSGNAQTTDDCGYHSDDFNKEIQKDVENEPNTTTAGVETETENVRDDVFHFDPAAWDIFRTPVRGRKAGRLSLDAGLKALQDLRVTGEGNNLSNDVIQEDVSEEKTKTGKLSAFKSWIQRKASDSTTINSKQETNPSKNSNFKRSSSLRRSKRETCESCFSSCSSLSQLLSRKGGTNAFRSFLQSEFSDENLDFWLECESFKRVRGAAKIHKVATKIFNQFLVGDSPSEINVDSSTRDEVKSKLETPSLEMFDEAQERIFKLMEQDSFRRFLVSDFAHKCKTHATS